MKHLDDLSIFCEHYTVGIRFWMCQIDRISTNMYVDKFFQFFRQFYPCK
jgi:hypothetical protein